MPDGGFQRQVSPPPGAERYPKPLQSMRLPRQASSFREDPFGPPLRPPFALEQEQRIGKLKSLTSSFASEGSRSAVPMRTESRATAGTWSLQDELEDPDASTPLDNVLGAFQPNNVRTLVEGMERKLLQRFDDLDEALVHISQELDLQGARQVQQLSQVVTSPRARTGAGLVPPRQPPAALGPAAFAASPTAVELGERSPAGSQASSSALQSKSSGGAQPFGGPPLAADIEAPALDAGVEGLVSNLEVHASLASSGGRRTSVTSVTSGVGPEASNATQKVGSVRFQDPTSSASADGESEGGAFFELRREWHVGVRSFGERIGMPEEQYKTLDDHIDYPSDLRRERNKLWWIISPSSRSRMVWDMLTILLIGFDMAVIPVNLAFDTGDNVVSEAALWPSLLFWTFDVPLTFCTAIYRKGRLEYSPLLIAREYFFTWFLLDAAIVTSGWLEAIIGSQTSGLALGRVGKTLRVLRIMRSMRLLRLVKLRRIMEEFQDRVTSEYIHIMMNVIKLILIIVWTNHFIACTWWGIGVSGPRQGGPDSEWSWTSHFAFQDDPLGYQYFTALHWSLTQFTPASMEVSPRNIGERVFAVIVLLFAMIVFSSFVSSITAAMTQLRSLSSSVDKGFLMLRRYLRARSTPAELTVRIIRCVEHRLGVRKGEVPESEVVLLQYLSKPLQMELLSHVYAPYMTRHPFFAKLAEADPGAMQRVCLMAVQRVSLSTGDALFTEAFSGEQMFFVRSGRLRYYASGVSSTTSNAASQTMPQMPPIHPLQSATSSRSSVVSMKRSKTCKPVNDLTLEEGEWFCESSLWCLWAHMGTMIATQMSEVLALDAASFAAVTCVHRLVAAGAQRYGRAYVERLNSMAATPECVVGDVCQMSHEELSDMACHSFMRRSMNGTLSEAFDSHTMGSRQTGASEAFTGHTASQSRSDGLYSASCAVEVQDAAQTRERVEL